MLASPWWSAWPLEIAGPLLLVGGDHDPFWELRGLAGPWSGGTVGSMVET